MQLLMQSQCFGGAWALSVEWWARAAGIQPLSHACPISSSQPVASNARDLVRGADVDNDT